MEERATLLPRAARYPHLLPGTFYDHFRVTPSANATEIATSYRLWQSTGFDIAKRADKVKADCLDRVLTLGYQVLLTPGLRREYDRSLPVPLPAVPPPAPAAATTTEPATTDAPTAADE